MSTTRLPEQMTRDQLLELVKFLTKQVKNDDAKIEFLNATVRRLEADAVVTIAALVQQMGGEAIVMANVVEERRDYQIARTNRAEDNATIFRVAKKPAPEPPPAEGPPMEKFVPDGL